jgi:Mg/Co/Ni transporter MgtE
MDNEYVQSIVNNAVNDNPAGVKDAFYDAINDKIFAALEQRKQEIARNLVNYQNDADNSVEDETEIETEEDTETE